MSLCNISFNNNESDPVSDDRLKNNDIWLYENNDIRFEETQINSSYSTCKIIETLSLSSIGFNNKENKFLNLAYGCTNDTTVSNKFYTNGVSIFSFKKYDFANRVFILMLICRKQSLGLQEFSQFMEYLLAVNSIHIIVEDFNYDLLKVSENKILDTFTENVQRINKPTNISGSLTDYGCIKKTLWKNFPLT